MTGDYTRALADFCAELKWDSVPGAIREKIKWALLDNLGVVLGASATKEAKVIADYVRDLGDREEATALGFGFKSSMRNASFLNGTLSEVLELQDGYTKGGVHPCCGVISAALAVAEYNRKSGQDLLLSIIVGYEAADRVAEVLHPSHLGRGFQPTGTAGAVGAAAAAAKLLDFSPEQMFNAIGISGFILPISTGDNLWGGYTIKPVHGGAGAKAGVESALLAQRGLTACSLEGDPKLNKGFCTLVSDKPNYEKMTEELGEKYTISDVYFKPFACCRINHSPVEIAIKLATDNDLKPKDIAKVKVRTYNFAAAVPGNIRTNVNSNLLDCQFSTSYTVASALSDRRVSLEQFTPEKIQNPDLQDLASRVSIEADPEMEALRPANRACIVEVTLKDGKTVSGRVDYPLGDPRKPFSDDDLMKKFQGLAAHALSPEKVSKLGSMVFKLDEVADVGELVALCS